MPFPDFSLQLTSVGTSEVDCKDNLSVQREIVDAHETNYETSSISAQLPLLFQLQLHEFSHTIRKIGPQERSEVSPVPTGHHEEESGQSLDRI
jgi:hypothetical protein